MGVSLRRRRNLFAPLPSLLCGAVLAVGGTAAMMVTDPLGAAACQNNQRYYYADATSSYPFGADGASASMTVD